MELQEERAGAAEEASRMQTSLAETHAAADGLRAEFDALERKVRTLSCPSLLLRY